MAASRAALSLQRRLRPTAGVLTQSAAQAAADRSGASSVSRGAAALSHVGVHRKAPGELRRSDAGAGGVAAGALGNSVPFALGHLSTSSAVQREIPHSAALKRLVHRSKQRGVLELDLLVGRWTGEHIGGLSEKQLNDLTWLLDQESPDLLQWLLGQAQPPAEAEANEVFQAIRSQVTQRLRDYHNPETKANPGAAWVKGWGDIGGPKTPGMPPGGNQ